MAFTGSIDGRDQHDLERRGLLAAPRLVEPHYREDLERAAEVQDLDIGKDKNSDSVANHGALPLLNAAASNLNWQVSSTEMLV